MKKYFILLAFAVMAMSCSKEQTGTDSAGNNAEPAYTTGQSYMRALKAAEAAPQLFGTEETKSDFKVVKKGIPVVSDELTKSGTADTLLYIFNYEGDNGYAMVPKDERKGFVLAYSDNGSFNIADTAENVISKYVLDNVIAYCEIEVVENPDTKIYIHEPEYKRYVGYLTPYKGNCSNLKPLFRYDFSDVKPLYSDRTYYETIGCTATLDVIYLAPGDVDPLMPTCWGQGYPYNQKSPLIDGKNAWAGCVAAASAQIMAYHGFPVKYPAGTYVNGVYKGDTATKIETLRNTKYGNDTPGPGFRDFSSTLYRVIGDQVDMQWGLDGSGAYSSRVPSMLKWFGYTSAPAIKSYDIDELEQSLRQGYPVYVAGVDSEGDGSHAYVIDGFKMMHRGFNYYVFDENGEYHNRRIQIISSGEPAKKYVHINFGWDGTSNGFYLNEVFDTNDRFNTFPTKANYNYNLRMIPFIHP